MKNFHFEPPKHEALKCEDFNTNMFGKNHAFKEKHEIDTSKISNIRKPLVVHENPSVPNCCSWEQRLLCM
jgi:hypothetical protein